MANQAIPLRVLFLADSHLGFDLPTRPRVVRRRRGHDFQANHERALAPALEGKVDLVVHGGDVFHRSRVPPSLVYQAFRPMVEIAQSGIPVFVVPGNHERSRIPHDRLAAHPNLHLFRGPETEVVELRGLRVGLSGFPYVRRGVRDRFPGVLEETGWKQQEADIRLLCFHHCVEGATVGPSDYTFRNASDVIRCADLPQGFAAVLSGHIHRHQVLREDLQGHPLPTPVHYPGSVERTAFAEMDEEKGFQVLEFEPGGGGGTLVRDRFVPLPARPMVLREINPTAGPDTEWPKEELEAQLTLAVEQAPRDAVLRVRIHGHVGPHLRPSLAAAHLRRMAPPEMNLEIFVAEDRGKRGLDKPGQRGQRPGNHPLPSTPAAQQQLDVPGVL